MKSDIVDIIDDRLEKRFESYAQAQIKIHEEAHRKLLEAVSQQIQITVNGKIDKIQKTLDNLDSRIKPFEEGVSWFTRAKNGAGWVAGFLTSLSLIGMAVIWLIKQAR